MERKYCKETDDKDWRDWWCPTDSGSSKSARTEVKIELVEEIVLIQEDQPETHSAPVEIAHELNIDHRSVSHIIDQDLYLCSQRKCKLQNFLI